MRAFPTGCWTCKLRHRKCDLRVPACRECRQRGIPRHGYGPKPAWMDGAAAERQELARVKEAVRRHYQNLRQNQNRDRQPTREASPIARAPLGTPPSPSHPQHASVRDAHDRPERNYDSEPGRVEHGHGQRPARDVRSAATGSVRPASSCVFQPESASLLMHYLDHVFYWQFPYFRPCSRLGDRGWLLLFLSNSGPLYHAALALSALHRNAVQTAWRVDRLRNQQVFEYHSQALRELGEFSRFAEVDSPLSNKAQLAEFLASSLMLISFEVFHGAEHDWLPHLDAVTAILSMHSPTDLVGHPTCSNSPASYPDSVGCDLISEESQPEVGFIIAQAIWFDILACVSTDRVPRIAYRQWLEALRLDMSDLMGCYNWVMTSIGDLAHLQAWKADMKDKGTLSMPELVTRSREIETRLRDGIAELESAIEEAIEAAQAAWVSYVFALASLVLSSTIVSGPWASLPEIRATVEKAVRVLRGWPRAISLQGLVWPLFVLGCMAESKHQAFFESFLAKFVEECRGFGNGGTVLKTMQDSWMLQKHRDGDWIDMAFRTGTRVLLI